MFTIVCPISKCPKIQQDKNLSNFVKLRCQNNGNLKIYDFLQKLKKVVHIVLYGPAISQSDCRKAGPYQLPLIMPRTSILFKVAGSGNAGSPKRFIESRSLGWKASIVWSGLRFLWRQKGVGGRRRQKKISKICYILERTKSNPTKWGDVRIFVLKTGIKTSMKLRFLNPIFRGVILSFIENQLSLWIL